MNVFASALQTAPSGAVFVLNIMIEPAALELDPAQSVGIRLSHYSV
jgi:hypothetical protein